MRLRLFPIVAGLLTAVVIAGCGHKAEEFFPLEKGRYWEYRMKVSILGHDAVQKQVYRNQGTGELDGKTVLIREYPGGGHGYFRVTREGVERVASAGLMSDDLKADPERQFVLKMPFRPGTRWQSTSRLSLIESRTFEPTDRIIPLHVPVHMTFVIEADDDMIRVPAGDFTGCLRVHGTGALTIRVDRGYHRADIKVDEIDWYAPGVGLIKSQRTEASASYFLKTGTYLLELEQSH